MGFTHSQTPIHADTRTHPYVQQDSRSPPKTTREVHVYVPLFFLSTHLFILIAVYLSLPFLRPSVFIMIYCPSLPKLLKSFNSKALFRVELNQEIVGNDYFSIIWDGGRGGW